jgi:hypothetical protein
MFPGDAITAVRASPAARAGLLVGPRSNPRCCLADCHRETCWMAGSSPAIQPFFLSANLLVARPSGDKSASVAQKPRPPVELTPSEPRDGQT